MKKRLDVVVHEQGLAPSREMARRFIMAGEVRVDGQIMDKPGTRINTAASVTLQTQPRFVSRGGEKLAAAFDAFALDVNGAICADVGASTGGFTDCLLQNGAAKVYAIDVGYGQMALKLRDDPRVILLERTNARYVQQLDEPVQFVSVDASFISLRLLLPIIKNWLTARGEVVALIKPQFEAGKQEVGKGGVVKDAAAHRRVLEEILSAAAGMGYTVRGVVPSPITGPKGNIEFLAWLSVNADADSCDTSAAIQTAIQQAHDTR